MNTLFHVGCKSRFRNWLWISKKESNKQWTKMILHVNCELRLCVGCVFFFVVRVCWLRLDCLISVHWEKFYFSVSVYVSVLKIISTIFLEYKDVTKIFNCELPKAKASRHWSFSISIRERWNICLFVSTFYFIFLFLFPVLFCVCVFFGRFSRSVLIPITMFHLSDPRVYFLVSIGCNKHFKIRHFRPWMWMYV